MSILTKNSVSCNVFEPLRREKATPSQEVAPVPVLIKNNKINRPKNTQCNYTDTVAKNCGVNDERNQRSEGTGIPPEFEGSEGSGRARSSWREASKARDNGAVDDGRQGRDADANSPINLARPGEARDCWDEAIFSRRSSAQDVHLSSRGLAAGRDNDSGRGKNGRDRGRSSNLGRDESRGQKAPQEASKGARGVRTLQDLFPLSISVGTRVAAQVLGLKPQTLRRWASYQTGPVQPTRVGSRQMWLIDDLQRVLDGQSVSPLS